MKNFNLHRQNLKQLKIILTVVACLFSLQTFAQKSSDSGSEFQHQAKSGKIELTPELTFGQTTVNFNGAYTTGQTSVNDNYSNFSIMGEYGFNRTLSAGVKLGYQTELVPASGGNASSSGSGLTDTGVFLNGRVIVGSGLFRFGGNLSFASGASVTNNDNNVNEYSGGITFTPRVGYEKNVGHGILGARVSYDLIQTDRNISIPLNSPNYTGGTSAKIAGGNVLTATAFYEVPMARFVWGLNLSAFRSNSTKFFDSVTPSTDDHDGYIGYLFATYGSWSVSRNIKILPTVGYGVPRVNLTAFDSSGETSSAGLYASLAARFEF